VRFGERAARVRLAGTESDAPVETEVTIVPGEGKQVRLNGALADSAETLRARISALVFVPDRLAVVKGGPAVRRAYLDRMLGRVFPAQASLPGEYGRALAQRNEALRRTRSGSSTAAAVAPWTERVAVLGSRLDESRARLVSLLAPSFAEGAAALGLEDASLSYPPSPLSVADLESRLSRDLERGTTGLGPHLRDADVVSGGRELRAFGSQGEQRTAVLALVLAEATALAELRGSPPLLLLDDVLSELDRGRRAALLRRLPAGGQAIVTATSADAVPEDVEPALVIRVSRGERASFAEAA
jgi:DNA replication and repair protein RecF